MNRYDQFLCEAHIPNYEELVQHLNYIVPHLHGHREDEEDRNIESWVINRFLKKIARTDTPEQYLEFKLPPEGGEPEFDDLTYEARTDIDHIMDWLDWLSNNDRREYIKALKADWDTAVTKSEQWTEELNKRHQPINADEGVKTVIAFPDGYKLVALTTNAARQQEGQLMKHCVGCYEANVPNIIFSLRDPNNKPHVTLEYSPELEMTYKDIAKEYYQKDTLDREELADWVENEPYGIRQIKGKANSEIKEEYVPYIQAFLNRYNVKIATFDGAGYFDMDPEELEDILEDPKGVLPAIDPELIHYLPPLQ